MIKPRLSTISTTFSPFRHHTFLFPLHRLNISFSSSSKNGVVDKKTSERPTDPSYQYQSQPPPQLQNKDPMAGMTEEEKEEAKKEIRDGSRRAFNIGYSIIGGMAAGVVKKPPLRLTPHPSASSSVESSSYSSSPSTYRLVLFS